MPRFMTLVRIDERNLSEQEFDAGFEERMGALFEEMTKAGAMLDTAGLAPTSEATRMTWSGGKVSYTDGPFTESKEVIGGYCIAQCKDKAEAMEWTRRFLQCHPENVSFTVEVREITGG